MQGIGYHGQLSHDGRQNLHDVFAVLPHIGNKAGKCADAVGYKCGAEERRPCYAISNFGYSVFALNRCSAFVFGRVIPFHNPHKKARSLAQTITMLKA